MQGGVRFTPYARAQVEGYLIPDHENNLDYAVCYIWPHHQKEVISSLLNECLLRALGLPEMMAGQDSGLLGHWNTTYDKVSKRSVLDGPTLVNEVFSGLMPIGMDEEADRRYSEVITKYGKQDSFADYPPIAEQRASELDLALLSMLYCKDIRPGMGRYEILDVFYTSNSCFAFAGIGEASK